MIALTAAPDAPGGVALREVAEPEPREGEALVAVEAVSLNRGETRRIPDLPDGALHGWDLAGTVRRAAANRSGPPEGTRVVGLVASGAWAQIAAVDTRMLAVL